MESIQDKKHEEEEEIVAEPVSPTGQYINSSALSLSIIAILELEIPFDESLTFPFLQDLLLRLNPRFSSVMVTDDHGVKQWKRVEVKLKDHVKIPSFPMDVSKERYDMYLDDYLSEIANAELPKEQPLWELHIFKYPTSNATGTIIFKLHHALGDGFYLMGILFSCCNSVDNPSNPIMLPSLRSRSKPSDHDITYNIRKLVKRFRFMLLDTASVFAWTCRKCSIVEDDKTPIRSGNEGVEFRPMAISTINFSLDHIKQIKNKLAVTVNDVITGIVLYGTRLYMQNVSSEDSGMTKSSAAILVNTRAFNNYQTIEKMASSAKSLPGNQFAFIHVSTPKTTDVELADPLEFIHKAKKRIQKQRSSLALHLTGKLLKIITKLRGPEATAQYIHGTIRKSSFGISNMIGPIEHIAFANHPCKGMYFMPVGVPYSLNITVLSYMGNVRVALGTEKGFINHPVLINCLEKAFDRTFAAALATS
ncbi:O-acyltransferase wsd1 [Thalictrum thalictroides]|uniref:O-acyltransferase wsd1 n=1 Tax=Thalictrum thalictroides TaxID=46969 RepID=A0A7J6VV71_THATH|nr:O-acyltransferase wsd1 [Thalictrum thalictroides]